MSQSSSNELGWKGATLEYLSRLPVRDWPTQRELTRRLSISEHFYRCQLRLEGASFKALKLEVRMNRAIKLLSSGFYRSIAEVADDMEFCDEHSFRKMFKRWTGCSPARYLIRHEAPSTR
ncbi:helix-turn-helix domain-containing protein [Pseudomonas sp. DC418]|uniref:helix-turn-helix domain-containing protein n=1 Tax=Pseudomonas sp. DC418 TaxID=3418478 RepID=UPI003D2E927A